MFKAMMYGEDATLLGVALNRNLFPHPSEDEEILTERISGNRIIIYFDKSYYKKLLSSMKKRKKEGGFEESNSKEEWNHLLDRITAKQEAEDVDRSRLDEYPFI